MPGEPLGLQLTARHLPGHDNLERPLTKNKIRNGFWRCDQLNRLLVRNEFVPLVHVPVEFFLKGDHPATDAPVFLAGGGGGEFLGKSV